MDENIAYEDLVKILEAIPKLRSQYEIDVKNGLANASYFQTEFITIDGFEIGYYIDGNKPC